MGTTRYSPADASSKNSSRDVDEGVLSEDRTEDGADIYLLSISKADVGRRVIGMAA